MLKCRENNPQVPVQAVSGFASWLGGGGGYGMYGFWIEVLSHVLFCSGGRTTLRSARLLQAPQEDFRGYRGGLHTLSDQGVADTTSAYHVILYYMVQYSESCVHVTAAIAVYRYGYFSPRGLCMEQMRPHDTATIE